MLNEKGRGGPGTRTPAVADLTSETGAFSITLSVESFLLGGEYHVKVLKEVLKKNANHSTSARVRRRRC